MYQVIARKYRPQTFDEVVGQSHVKQTLRNAIDQGRIAHGYIFSGPRGTGKTTLARILAMALNCEGGPSSSPDPHSAVCQEIAAGGSLDVVEIDAASNRRIDDIRELRESVKFRPVRDRYKVFIIDEAHQITSDAFNALLKTLEEPPEWAVFVLCTTEPQAIPATIVSRCQSFAFRALDQPDVLQHLRKICLSEGVEAEDDALAALALAGDGSIRDSLSTLDQAIAAFGKHLESGGVRDLVGAIPSEMTERILSSIRDADPAAMLTLVDDLFSQGRHPQHFCGELTRQFRNLMVMKVAGSDSKLVAAGKGERDAADTWIEDFSNEDLIRYVQILLALYQDLQQATQQRFRLEIGLLKLVYAGRLRPIEEMLSGLPASGSAKQPRPPSGPPAPRPTETAPSRTPAPTKAASADLRPPAERAPEPAPAERPDASRPAAAPTQPDISSARPAKPEPAPASTTDAPVSAPQPASPQPEAQTVPSASPTDALPDPPQQPRPVQPVSQAPKDGDIKQQLLAAIKASGESFLAEALADSRVEQEGRTVTIHVTDQWMTMVELQRGFLDAALMGLVGGKPSVRLVSTVGGPSGQRQAPPSRPRGSDAPASGSESDVGGRAQSDPAFLEFQKRIEGRVTNVMDLREKS